MVFLQDEKNKLCRGIELLNQEKDKLQSDIEFLNEDKAEFIRSAIQEVNDSNYEREKTIAENEKMLIELKEMNQTLVAKERVCTEELQEARQELIKVMVSKKVTGDGKIGVKTVRNGEQVLWNFREGRRASLKEVIRLQFNHTNK
ncbi:hypothetical protein MKW94_000488 [Papaver nudicaule]|uniref:Uncharacterized protein n=1 Tax=Papaver nudicaule TaxID=74823 RepID=A0AA42B5P3_PAPNU|nr:hypothetical protein [Papaver nudicaule]